MNVDTQAHQEWRLAGCREVGSVLKVSPGTPERLDLKEREDQQV